MTISEERVEKVRQLVEDSANNSGISISRIEKTEKVSPYPEGSHSDLEYVYYGSYVIPPDRHLKYLYHGTLSAVTANDYDFMVELSVVMKACRLAIIMAGDDWPLGHAPQELSDYAAVVIDALNSSFGNEAVDKDTYISWRNWLAP